MKITLTGATGFIGGPLVKRLAERGHELTILTRHPRTGANPRHLAWDARSAPPLEAMEADAIVHLAGEPVGQRWTADVKRRIRASRIEGTRAVVEGIAAARSRPKVLVSASAIGIYGSRGDEVLTERSAAGSGFLEDVTVEWERESARANEAGVRVVNPRIGIVLGRDGGALARMLPPFKAGAGGRLGSGHQWMSWIHIDDVAGLILFALENESLRGALNLTSPNPVTNADFTAALSAALRRPALFPVPVFALKLLFGEMAEVLLASQRVIPQAALDAGYHFAYPELGPALRDLVG
jgi:uncharacterized protein (TIGR01777 family)